MGGINMSSSDFVDHFIEIVGYKSGVVIGRKKLFQIVEDYDPRITLALGPEGAGSYRMHSSEFESIVAHLLHRIGNIDDPSTMPVSIRLFHQSKNDPVALKRYEEIMETYTGFMRRALRTAKPASKIDPSPFLQNVFDRFGVQGVEMAMRLLRGVNHQLHISPWGRMRAFEWSDEVELETLFRDEGLETLHGKFFDQRFIDYLNNNFDDLGDIHWRKFEALAGEYFERQGFKVEMGPGRNDDGIDLRIYPMSSEVESPPLILVQCKRQKAAIGKALIKSVYADVLHEKAGSGLIVTSSRLSPGAAALRTARGYPIEAADRKTLQDWISNMKTHRLC
ncbi:restriction endonuclease [Henriciella litoralis]|uniref:restriction endonuclease n=1 Tax=Henriciella litoralis TaxID=568102 RepID=UPI0009FCFB48|nr:restriction endonuclease [Henriciella litoralis]